jgi:hypothetical protein
MPVRACVDQVSDRDLTAATVHAANSLLKTIGMFRWQFSHIRQPAQQEGWVAAEIGTFWTCSMKRDDVYSTGRSTQAASTIIRQSLARNMLIRVSSTKLWMSDRAGGTDYVRQ